MLYRDALREFENSNTARAIEVWNKTKSIDERYADVDFQLGTALFDRGLYDEAARAFKNALENDVCPLRAPLRFANTVKSVAGEHDVACVDYPRLLRESCQKEYGHRILGSEYFLDHVHPTIDAHRMLAEWIIQTGQANIRWASIVGCT